MSNASRALIAALSTALVGISLLAGGAGRAPAADPEVTAIDVAPPLTWGFKQSWRNYAPVPEVSDGASVDGTTFSGYNVNWSFVSGSYDVSARSTRLSYSGSVHWQKYRASTVGWPLPPGYSGPDPDPYVLDLTMADPEITISREAATVTAVVSSRSRSTFEIVDYGRIPVVALDPLGIVPTVAGSATEWSGIPATITAVAATAFSYQPGQVADEVSFSYTGPGGAPDFSEHWDEPGAAKLKLLQNQLFVNSETTVGVDSLVERENLIVHSLREVDNAGVPSRRLEAFDLEQMSAVGTPLVLINKQAPLPSRIIAHDTNENRWIYRGATPSEAGITRWIRFNAGTESYETGVLSDPQMADPSFIGEAGQRLVWDPTRERGYRVDRVVPEGVEEEDYDQHQWQLLTYAEGEDGTWTRKAFDLPGFGSGQNAEGYNAYSTYEMPVYATASDGSLIVLATMRSSSDPSHPAPATIPGAYRLTFNAGDTAVDVQPLPVTVPNTPNGPFSTVQTSANGHILLVNRDGEGDAIHCRVEAGAVACDDPVSIASNVELPPFYEQQFAIDPADGTVWFGGATTQKMGALGGGAFLGGQFFKERNPRGGPVLVADEHVVYAQTNDGGPREFGGVKAWGYGKFERLGFVPTVTGQPQPTTVFLAAAQDSANAVFASAATGDPAPARQWQVKAAGTPSFEDIAGETGPTLSVAATRAMNGNAYRAVYANAAGRVASQAVDMEVRYAPLLLIDANDATATAGDPAEFLVRPGGNPEPIVTWQRRVGGFWQSIPAGDDNFGFGDSTLTVSETNTEQSGALFRAKLTSPEGTAFSRAAKLTVLPKITIPLEGLDLEDVSLEWTGSAEMQKAPFFGDSNFFSAGVSDGEQATYDAFADNAVVYQVSSSGTEAIATWATRAAHVSNGGHQLVRLYGGEARIEPDGSASVEWNSSWSVNFYGGLVPFTFTDPELHVDADGAGVLSADMSGCESSKDSPDECTPFATSPDVAVATFSDVEIDPAGAVTIEPNYAGVEVTVPVPFVAQDRVVTGWGAWPQPFVDFQVKTGLSSHWYSSGGAFDPDKAPDPFVVDFDGEPVPADPGPGTDSYLLPTEGARRQSQPEPGRASIAAPVRAQSVGRGRQVRVATLSCPATSACEVAVPGWVRVRIDGVGYRARVLAPAKLSAGESAAVKVRLSRAALRALGNDGAVVRVRIVLRADGEPVRRVAAVEVT